MCVANMPNYSLGKQRQKVQFSKQLREENEIDHVISLRMHHNEIMMN